MSAALALTWRQYRLERRMFWRNPSAAFFNFVLPLLFLALFGAIFAGSQEDLDVIVPGIAGMSVMTTTFVALAMNLVFLREQGVLKRLRGTPLPSGAYLGGARRRTRSRTRRSSCRSSSPPARSSSASAARGLARCSASSSPPASSASRSLGVALSHAIPNFDSAPAYVNAIFLPVIIDQRRLLRRRRRARVPARHRRGAAADAPDRRAVGGDGHRRARSPTAVAISPSSRSGRRSASCLPCAASAGRLAGDSDAPRRRR